MMKKFTRSILTRYIISYGIIIGILIAGISFYVNRSIKSATLQSVEDANINRLGVLRMQHEEKLTNLFDITKQIGLLPGVQPFRFMEAPMGAFHLKQNLAAFTSITNIYDQVYVIFDNDHYLYSSATSVSLPLFSEEMMKTENIEPEALSAFIRNEKNAPSFISTIGTQCIYTKNENVVMMSVPLCMNGRTRIGSVVFMIPQSAYRKMFEDSVYELRNMYIIQDGEILSSVNRLDNINDEAVIEASKTTSSAVQNMMFNGENYLMFVQEGAATGMKYISLIPENAVHTQSTQSLLMFGVFLLIVLFPCLVLAVKFSRIFVKPIHEIRNAFYHTNEVESAKKPFLGEHFADIRNGIERLEEQNTMLHQRLDDSRNACAADFVKNFVKLNYREKSELITDAQAFGIDVQNKYYALVLLNHTLPPPCEDEYRNEFLIRAVVSFDQVSVLRMDTVHRNQYLLLIFADTPEEIEGWIKNTYASLLEADTDTVMALSNIYADVQDAGTAYLEASAAFDNRFVMGTDSLLKFSDVSMAATGVEEFTSGFMDSFNDAFLSGDIHAVHLCINQLVHEFGQRQLSLVTFRIIYNDIVSVLLSRYTDSGEGKDRLRFYDVFHLSNCRKASDIAAILRDTCEEIMSRQRAKVSPVSQTIMEIFDYLRQNFNDPNLSIGEVARKFDISAASLSQEYKKVTGMNPSDHLALLRMNKARELLTETDMLINAVSVAVGYYDVISFIRRFKKEMSMTPAQYRKFSMENNLNL